MPHHPLISYAEDELVRVLSRHPRVLHRRRYRTRGCFLQYEFTHRARYVVLHNTNLHPTKVVCSVTLDEAAWMRSGFTLGRTVHDCSHQFHSLLKLHKPSWCIEAITTDLRLTVDGHRHARYCMRTTFLMSRSTHIDAFLEQLVQALDDPVAPPVVEVLSDDEPVAASSDPETQASVAVRYEPQQDAQGWDWEEESQAEADTAEDSLSEETLDVQPRTQDFCDDDGASHPFTLDMP